MCHWWMAMHINNTVMGIIDDVVLSKNKSTLWTTVTSLVFNKKTPQNVGNLFGYNPAIVNFNFKLLIQLQFDIKYGKRIYMKSMYHIADVTDNVTAWRQIQPPILFVNIFSTFFKITSKWIKKSLSKLVHICITGIWAIWWMFVLTLSILDVSQIVTVVSSFIFKIGHWFKGSNMIVCVLLVSNSRGCCLAPRRDNTRGSTHNHVWSRL